MVEDSPKYSDIHCSQLISPSLTRENRREQERSVIEIKDFLILNSIKIPQRKHSIVQFDLDEVWETGNRS